MASLLIPTQHENIDIQEHRSGGYSLPCDVCFRSRYYKHNYPLLVRYTVRLNKRVIFRCLELEQAQQFVNNTFH